MCLGGLFGGGGSSSSGGTTNNSVAEYKPPDYTVDPWKQYIQGVEQYTQTPYQQYGGMQVAPINDIQQQGINLIQDRALNGAPDLNAGRGAAMNIANGAYFNNNPWLSNDYTNQVINDNANVMANAFARGTAAQTDAQFARAGAYGGSAYQDQQAANATGLNNSIGQMANQYQLQRTGMGAQDYQQGVNQMLGAGNLAGSLSQDDWKAGQMLTGAGDAQQQYLQTLLNSSQSAFNQQQQYPAQMLDILRNALQAAGGGQGTSSTQSTQGYNVNPISALLGGGLSIGSLLGGS